MSDNDISKLFADQFKWLYCSMCHIKKCG
jgi:hypothetical protein